MTRRDYNLRKHYGITEDRYREEYEKRKGRCDICGTRQKVLAVDHCHDMLVFRGLLCRRCNLGLGFFHDDKVMLILALKYLRKAIPALLLVVLLVACHKATPVRSLGAIAANCNNPPTFGVSGPLFATNMANCFNGTSEIDPLLGTGTVYATGAEKTCDANGLIAGNVYDVMCPAFGAKNDFVDDDLVPIQTAVYAACHATAPTAPTSSIPKGPLYFPPNQAQGANGLYLHSAPIRLTCGNMEIFGKQMGTGGVHAPSALFQNYYGPAFIATADGSNTLQYVTRTNGTTGSALKTNGCSGVNCGTVELSDLIGFFGPQKLSGLSQLSVELFFTPTSPVASQVNQIIGAQAGSIASSSAVSFNIFGAFNTSTLTATLDVGGVVKTLTGSSLSNALHSIALDYDGTTIRLCIDGSLATSTAATGTITQNPFEMITLPNQSQSNWPDAYGPVGTTWPGTIGQIRISNTARHASSCTMSSGTDFATDNNTLAYVKWDNTNGTDVLPWQTAYFGSGPTTAYLPIHGTNSGYEVAGLYMHDMELGGPLFAIWSPDSTWQKLSASSNSQIPAFDFNEDDWLNTTRDLYAHDANAMGFEFGSRYNEGININDHAETTVHGIGYESISNGGTQDSHPVVQSSTDLYWPWVFIGTQALLDFPFADLETADSNYQGWMYTNGNFGNIQVNNAQITTFNNAPFITVNCNSGAPVILNGADFGAVSNTSQYFHFLGSPNCLEPPQLINATSLSTGGTTLTDNANIGHALFNGSFSVAPFVFNGTSGAATCVQSGLNLATGQHQSTCKLVGYAETGAAQTWTYPVAYAVAPILSISGGSCGSFNPTTSTSVLTFPANAGMTAESCNIIVLGQ